MLVIASLYKSSYSRDIMYAGVVQNLWRYFQNTDKRKGRRENEMLFDASLHQGIYNFMIKFIVELVLISEVFSKYRQKK